MLGKSTHLIVIPQQSTKNTANLLLQTCEKKTVNFNFRNNFANLGSFAKVFIAVQLIIPWSKSLGSWELWHFCY